MNKLPRSIAEYVTRSTMKREIAVGLDGWWLGVGTHLLVRVPVTQIQPDAALVAWGSLAPFFIGFTALAFGMDWMSKQTTIAGPPMNTEITTTAEITDDKATVTQSSEQKV